MTPDLDAIERAALAALLGDSWRSRAYPDIDGSIGWRIEAELPCINGLSAWFALALVYKPDAAEIGYTDGAIDNAEERATYIAAADPSVVLALVREVREMRQRVRDLASGKDPIGDAKDAAALKSASGERISVFAASADPTTRTFKRPT